MIPTPIKRSKNLVPLSKDHHEGLLVVWKIRQGLRSVVSNGRIADFVLHAFEKHLEPHFIEEEKLLFPKLPGNDELLIKAVSQHAFLRQMVAELRANAEPTTTRLKSFGNLLEEHIRFEERELFRHIEQEVPAGEMEIIGAELQAIHSTQQPLYWEDEFWVRK